MTFERAKACYVHRFTVEHVPAWATKPFGTGRYPAPQYRSDAEWFAADCSFLPTIRSDVRSQIVTHPQTWPLGTSLDKPFSL